jgi:hypothetical protein
MRLPWLPNLIDNESDLAKNGEAFELLNVRLFVEFQPVKIKRRTVNRLFRGVVTFGDVAAPVRLYAGPTTRAKVKGTLAATVAASPATGQLALPDCFSNGREGKSLGNVSRGDMI